MACRLDRLRPGPLLGVVPGDDEGGAGAGAGVGAAAAASPRAGMYCIGVCMYINVLKPYP